MEDISELAKVDLVSVFWVGDICMSTVYIIPTSPETTSTFKSVFLTQDSFFPYHTVITSEAISLPTKSPTSSTLTFSKMDAGYSAALTPATCDTTNTLIGWGITSCSEVRKMSCFHSVCQIR